MSSLDALYCQDKGFYRLGLRECQVDVYILDHEKIDLGKAQSQSLIEIAILENQLADMKKDFANKIGAHKDIVKQTSEMLSTGKRPVKKKLPCFLDSKNGEVHFIDEETGEIVGSRPASLEDRQMELRDE